MISGIDNLHHAVVKRFNIEHYKLKRFRFRHLDLKHFISKHFSQVYFSQVHFISKHFSQVHFNPAVLVLSLAFIVMYGGTAHYDVNAAITKTSNDTEIVQILNQIDDSIEEKENVKNDSSDVTNNEEDKKSQKDIDISSMSEDELFKFLGITDEETFDSLLMPKKNKTINMYSDEDKTSEVIGRISSTSAVKLISDNNKWYEVENEDGSLKGFVKANLMSTEVPNLAKKRGLVKSIRPTVNSLEVYKKASFMSETITTVNKSDLVTLIKSKGEFYKVKLANGVIGFVDKISTENTFNFTEVEDIKFTESVINSTAASVTDQTMNGELNDITSYWSSYGTQQPVDAGNVLMPNVYEAPTAGDVTPGSVEGICTKHLDPVTGMNVNVPEDIYNLPDLVGTTSERKALVYFALSYVGNKYVWGGTDLENGTDCSGFTLRVMQRFGYQLPRVSSDQRSAGTSISEEDLKPGDLICYYGHVAIYIGNGHIVHASCSKPYPEGGIRVSNDYNYRSVAAFRRILSD